MSEVELTQEELQQIYREPYGDGTIEDDYQLKYYRQAFGEDPPAELMDRPVKDQDVEFGSAAERALAAGISKEEIKRIYRQVYREMRSGKRAQTSRRQVELANGKQPTVATGKRMGPDEAMAYRDALERVRKAADERLYEGLAEVILQARRTGDPTLEQAAWDVARERDERNPGQAWVETIEMALTPPPEPVRGRIWT